MSKDKIKVLVVEDSPVVQMMLTHLLNNDPQLQVIGTVNNGQEAVDFVAENKPDVILMDVHMPGMDGYVATRRIMETHPVPIVISSATMSTEEVGETFHALEAGAVAFVEKPAGLGSPGFDQMVQKLLQTVKLMAEVKVVKRWPRDRWSGQTAAARPVAELPRRAEAIQVVAIGASTGGPPVIQTILKGLPKEYPVPILVVQHIAPDFLDGMVDWLRQTTPLSVQLAVHGATALAGHVYLAPDGFHLGLLPGKRILLSEDDPENGLRPSVSFLFRSVANVCAARAVGVLLTGMGRDGADELKLLKDKGAVTIAQDAETSVIHGMPGEAIHLGAALYTLPPGQIAAMLVTFGEPPMNTPRTQLLLVDDNPIDAALAQRLLRALGQEFPVDTCWVDSAEKALTEIQRHQYDLLLLDYQLPGASGLDVLTELQELPHGQQPAVIMLTASGSERVAVEAMKKGAKDYLRKDELAAAPLTRALMSALSQKRMQDQLERYVAQTQADLRMARQLQHALLPQRFPAFPHGAADRDTALRFHARYVSTMELGGDFYDVLPLLDTVAGVFVCDVMGHGVRAALITAMIRALVEELLPVACDPGQFLAGINHGLVAILKHAEEPLFATAFYLVADVAQGQMRYANAGHPLPFLLQRGPGTVVRLDFAGAESGPALGIFDAPTFTTASHILAPHDLVILFTDGLFEVRGADDKEFGQESLLAAVQERRQLPAGQLLDELIRVTRQGADSGNYGDDVCLLGVEVEWTAAGQGEKP